VLFFPVLGAVALLDAYMLLQLVQLEQPPPWLTWSAVRFVVGPALFGTEGVSESLADVGFKLALVNIVLAGLCVLAALGLGFKSPAAYWGSFALVGLMVVATLAGLLTRLAGWLPSLFRLGLAAFTAKWLLDSGPAFVWESRRSDASVDRGLKTGSDYYERGRRYYDRRMWAKAASHLQAATEITPSRWQYHAALANAYLKMGHSAAALVEADDALSLAPERKDLSAWRDSVAELEKRS
jgi:tetratricopeptide (TPR) repeat protein